MIRLGVIAYRNYRAYYSPDTSRLAESWLENTPWCHHIHQLILSSMTPFSVWCTRFYSQHICTINQRLFAISWDFVRGRQDAYVAKGKSTIHVDAKSVTTSPPSLMYMVSCFHQPPEICGPRAHAPNSKLEGNEKLTPKYTIRLITLP
jgi:hypothetical protein